MRHIDYLVVHTTASSQNGVDAAVIDGWHRNRTPPFRKIGYHYIIIDDRHPSFPDGHVQTGRALQEVGAHVLGLNNNSIGICCVGHGDFRDFTEAQKESLATLLAQLMEQYNLSTERIIGHRDINVLIDQRVVSDEYRTTKTCPGNKISMPEIRARAEAKRRTTRAPGAVGSRGMAVSDERRLYAGIRLVSRYIDKVPNASDGWNSFRNHPEVMAVIEKIQDD